MSVKTFFPILLYYIVRILHVGKYYNWYVFRRRLSRRLYRTVAKRYCNDAAKLSEGRQVVFVCNGNNESGGWADRLKGILSTYSVCKELHLDFRLLFTHPFPLAEFLEPNAYDWKIDEKDVVFAFPNTEIVAMEITEESDYQMRKQREWMVRRLGRSKARQVHVYTNAMFAYGDGFGALFSELFRLTPRLRSAVDVQRQMLGSDYISVSGRFLGCLGDFEDTVQIPSLPCDKRQMLLDACMEQLEKLHEKHPRSRLLVNSDSTSFLAMAQQLDYVYVIPGRILHLDVEDKSGADTYALYEKTFLDFFTIANASFIYRLDGQWMHTSGYPLAASKIYGRPFEAIKFGVDV